MAAAKLVVSNAKGGTQITLVGVSGTPLLSSKVFTEPRGKGATLRSLKGLLGEGIVVEDETLPASRPVEKPAAKATVKPTAKTTVKRAAKATVKRAVKSASRPAAKTAASGRGARTTARVAKTEADASAAPTRAKGRKSTGRRA